MGKIELLAPAGNLEKLKTAVDFGADAVFVGGEKFSLRSRASNFSLEQIREGCEYAHERGSKVHVTCNIVMHNDDLEGLEEWLYALEEAGVDAIIASSPYIIEFVSSKTRMAAHVSTQQSILNANAIEAFANLGADRVVLGREASLEDIENIVSSSEVEIEVFVHGAMCASYSGRCMLSNVMTNRDANRGGCAQSCRWSYDIYENDVKKNPDEHLFTFSSRDLCGIRYLEDLIKAGVTSLKIEGRMKSNHYIASVVGAYRKAIDEYYESGHISNIDLYSSWLDKSANRPYSDGFLSGEASFRQQLFDEENAILAIQDYFGIVLEAKGDLALIDTRNYFPGDANIEVISPRRGVLPNHILGIYDLGMNELEASNHPRSKVYVKTASPLREGELLRYIKEDEK